MNKYNLFSFILISLISFSSFNADISTIEFYKKDIPILHQILQLSNFSVLSAFAKQDKDEILKEQAQKILLMRWHISYQLFIHSNLIPALNGKKHLVLETIANHDFSNCDAEGATFYKCEFSNCTFTNTNMNHIELIQCNFTNCDFSGSHITKACIEQTNIIKSIFEKASLIRTTFKNCETITDCNFDNAKMDQLNIYFSTMKNCIFKGQESDLEYAIFDQSVIVNTNFEETNFCRAEITNCTLQNAQFISCSFLSAFITDSKLKVVSFEKSVLSDLTLDKNEFFQVDITEAHINPINFNEQKIIFRSLQKLRDIPGLFWQNNKAPILMQNLGKRSEEKKLPSPKR